MRKLVQLSCDLHRALIGLDVDRLQYFITGFPAFGAMLMLCADF